jgi:hypothetical protein
MEAFTKCQAQIRMKLGRDRYMKQQESALKIQKVFKGHAVRRKHNDKMARFKSHENLFEKVHCI